LPLRRTWKPIILCHYLEREREAGREEIGRKEGGGGKERGRGREGGREGERKERRREGEGGGGKERGRGRGGRVGEEVGKGGRGRPNTHFINMAISKYMIRFVHWLQYTLNMQVSGEVVIQQYTGRWSFARHWSIVKLYTLHCRT